MKKLVVFALVLVLLFSFTALAEQHHRRSCDKWAVVLLDDVIVRDANGFDTDMRVDEGFSFHATIKCQFELGGWFYGGIGNDGNEYYVFGDFLDLN